jgi:glutamine synthetase
VLNVAVADSLGALADELEKLTPKDFDGLTTILSSIVKDHKQVLFEGNNYSDEWHAEAERRGLPNNKSTVDALPALDTPKAKAVFSKLGVLSERELSARVDIAWERYVKVGNIEASAALDIARTMIMPATVRYLAQLYSVGSVSSAAEQLCAKVAELTDRLGTAIADLEHAQHEAHEATAVHDEAKIFVDKVIPAQNVLREVADELETVVADDLWPLPKYRELLFQY